MFALLFAFLAFTPPADTLLWIHQGDTLQWIVTNPQTLSPSPQSTRRYTSDLGGDPPPLYTPDWATLPPPDYPLLLGIQDSSVSVWFPYPPPSTSPPDIHPLLYLLQEYQRRLQECQQ